MMMMMVGWIGRKEEEEEEGQERYGYRILCRCRCIGRWSGGFCAGSGCAGLGSRDRRT